MFTGLIDTVGTVREVVPRSGATRIAIESDLPARVIRDGESIAVDGVCLTVTRRSGRRFWVDAVAETLAVTTLAGLRAGARVNLERALRAGDRLGGHFVQGHVDGIARVTGLTRRGGDCRLRVGLTPEIAPYVARKGSIALQGVSLTVADVGDDAFGVALIPETLARTTLGTVREGDPINVEVDLVARYLERLQAVVRPRRRR